MVKPQFELGPERVGKGGVVRDAADRRDALRAVAAAAAGGRARRPRLRLLGAPRPEGQPRDLHLGERRWRRARRHRGRDRARSSRERAELPLPGRCGPSPYSPTASPGRRRRRFAPPRRGRRGRVRRSSRPRRDRQARRRRRDRRRSRGSTATPTLPRARRRRHDPQALREYAGTGVPVFGINFGTIGFLAAVERDELDEGLRAAFAGDFEVMPLPGARDRSGRERRLALNDVSFIRRPHGRVAELVLPARRRGGRPRPLRRARRRHPGRIDRLQPRQLGPDPRLGRRGLRRQLHRPAHAHRARARRRPERHPAASPTPPGATRWTSPLDGEPVGELASGDGDRDRLPRRRRHARPAARGELLPPHAREVRAPGPLADRSS